MYSFENLNQILIGMSREILEKGIERKTRGFTCLEMPTPILIEMTNPCDRYVTIPCRKWNKYLPFAESLWMGLGMNDLDALPGHYVKNLYNYADDGRFWRAGYGPRLRAYSGLSGDYKISDPPHREITSGFVWTVDQLDYVIESLKRDINTRQAMIQFGDPVKDSFDDKADLLVTKDYPCSRTLQFMVVEGKLNCTLYIRSNDVLFGLSAVNITNFTIMQEYIASIIGVPVGKYYHFVNNLHAYAQALPRLEEIANEEMGDYMSEDFYYYPHKIYDLAELNGLFERLYAYERDVAIGDQADEFYSDNAMFNDWGKVFLHHKFGPEHLIEFDNPFLTKLFEI